MLASSSSGIYGYISILAQLVLTDCFPYDYLNQLMILSTTRGHRIITIFLNGSQKVHQELEFSNVHSLLAQSSV